MSVKRLLLALLLVSVAYGFVSPPNNHGGHAAVTELGVKGYATPEGKEYWLDEFKTADGEILNPYKVLKIKREANTMEIKTAYRELSKRFHPDKQRFRDVLPGRCNNLEEVRDEWERIKLSYEILRNPRTRKRYDRHEVLADPGGAVARAFTDAALGAVGKGLSGMGSGIFAMGAFALEKMKTSDQVKVETPESSTEQKP